MQDHCGGVGAGWSSQRETELPGKNREAHVSSSLYIEQSELIWSHRVSETDLFELVKSEKDYVADLELVQEVSCYPCYHDHVRRVSWRTTN